MSERTPAIRRFSMAWVSRILLITLSLPPVGSVRAQREAIPNAVADAVPATEATLSWPSGLAIDVDGNVFIAERRANRVRKLEIRSGLISSVAGNGSRGFDGDGGPAHEASISIPESIALDAEGNLYVADRGNARIRRVDAETGIITTVVGNGAVGYDGDGGPATAASLSHPFGLTVDSAGNLFIADTENHAVRRVDATSGYISTVAGRGEPGFAGDGGPAIDAQLNRPHNVVIDPDGNLVIGDSVNQRIRRVNQQTGVISTLYGTGEQGVSADGISAREASFAYFGSLLFDRDGNLLVAGWVDNRIRRIDAESGLITTVAGTLEGGATGDGGPATSARIHGPYGMAMDGEGNLYVAEAQANRIRRIDAETGTITTAAGR